MKTPTKNSKDSVPYINTSSVLEIRCHKNSNLISKFDQIHTPRSKNTNHIKKLFVDSPKTDDQTTYKKTIYDIEFGPIDHSKISKRVHFCHSPQKTVNNRPQKDKVDSENDFTKSSSPLTKRVHFRHSPLKTVNKRPQKEEVGSESYFTKSSSPLAWSRKDFEEESINNDHLLEMLRAFAV